MVQPYIESPLGGVLGVRTFTFYRLNAAGTQPVEPLGDLIPSLSGDRVSASRYRGRSCHQSMSGGLVL